MATDIDDDPARLRSRRAVHPLLERLAAYSWRLLVVGAAVVALLALLGRLRLVLIPLVVMVFLARVLAPPVSWLRARGWRPGLAAGAVVVGFLAALAGGIGLIGAAVADEVDELGPTLAEGVDDVERWVVEKSPFDVDQAEVDRFRRDIGDAVRTSLESSGGAVVSGAIVVAEVVVGVVLGLIVTFFALKDGDRFLAWARRALPPDRRALGSVMAGQAWTTLGGYLRGAALLGVVEGIAIGIALAVVGAKLAVPVALLTFLAAFVPFVGAIVAGAIAVLVALGTAGAGAAVIVLAVAVGLQQLDNDLLAPVVYGRALKIHPVVVLLGITAGGALFGLAGSFLAVPFIAVVVNVIAAATAFQRREPADAEADGDAGGAAAVATG